MMLLIGVVLRTVGSIKQGRRGMGLDAEQCEGGGRQAGDGVTKLWW